MEYKPNIYPIMYWAILYGVIAAVALLVFKLLAEYLTYLWFPVFLAGMIWGGYRKYTQDKKTWMAGKGLVGTSKSPVEEFKDAARDIAQASREMVAKNAKEDAQAAIIQQEAQGEPTLQEALEEQAAESAPAPESIPQTETPAELEYPAEHEEIVTQEPEYPAEHEEPRPPQSPTQPLV